MYSEDGLSLNIDSAQTVITPNLLSDKQELILWCSTAGGNSYRELAFVAVDMAEGDVPNAGAKNPCRTLLLSPTTEGPVRMPEMKVTDDRGAPFFLMSMISFSTSGTANAKWPKPSPANLALRHRFMSCRCPEEAICVKHLCGDLR